MGFKTQEKRISVDELEKSFRDKVITEAFGVGTAAVVAPVGSININDIDYHLPEYSHENLSFKLKNKLEKIRTGREEDPHNWNYRV